MRRIFAITLALAVLCAAACAEDEISARLRAAVDRIAPIMYGAYVDGLSVGPAWADDPESGLSALMYVVYDETGEDAAMGDLTVLVSNNLANAACRACPELGALTVYWDFTAYGLSAQITYTLADGDYQYGDAWLPPRFAVNYQ